MSSSQSGIAGIGLGLRAPFAEELLQHRRQVDWIEVTPENWVKYGGRRHRLLEECIERWPGVPHSVSLSIGGPDPLDEGFLLAMDQLCRKWNAPFYSDHVCYSTVSGQNLHDLLPLPFSEQALDHVVGRIGHFKQRVEAPLVLENATFYAHMPGGTMDEAAFLCEVLSRGDIGMLLDVNNVYVNSRNHGFDPRAFIDRMPLERVKQLHLAGHTLIGETIIDTHIGPIIDPVWDLYRYTLQRAGRLIPTLIEWDQEIPPIDQVLDEIDRAREVARDALLPAQSKNSEVA